MEMAGHYIDHDERGLAAASHDQNPWMALGSVTRRTLLPRMI